MTNGWIHSSLKEGTWNIVSGYLLWLMGWGGSEGPLLMAYAVSRVEVKRFSITNFIICVHITRSHTLRMVWSYWERKILRTSPPKRVGTLSASIKDDTPLMLMNVWTVWEYWRICLFYWSKCEIIVMVISVVSWQGGRRTNEVFEVGSLYWNCPLIEIPASSIICEGSTWNHSILGNLHEITYCRNQLVQCWAICLPSRSAEEPWRFAELTQSQIFHEAVCTSMQMKINNNYDDDIGITFNSYNSI